MRHPTVYLCARLVAFGICATDITACHRQSTGDTDDDRVAAHSADSARNATTEKSRSSATQAFEFDDAERARFNRVEQMIQAHFAGVQVTSSGGGFKIQIRGTGSFVSGNEPLVIIDGASRTVADLRSINTKDVQRIEIYKDAAASFYGSRGANGVIVIKTRRGP
jgi:TonB-dependent SusC/RagA subfamily outer membrane receptor